MKNYFIYLFIITFVLLSAQEEIGEGLYGAELLSYIHNNYKTSSTESYNNARDILYSQIDREDNGNISCIYTNYSIYLPNNVDPSTHLYENGMNCEHIWPQSMYDVITSNLMKSDMHHLRPCKENVNSYRGNKPFNESNDSQTNNWLWLNYNSSSIPTNNINEYSENGSSLFEPREDVKGDIARSMFYFYAIYPDEANESFFNEQKAVLFDWHSNDPIIEDEINRTWQIAGYQNNIPNPFILDETLIYRAFFYIDNISGDINMDGFVNIVDIILIVNYIVDNTTFSSEEIIIADYNEDNIVNIIDIIIIMSLILGEI